MRPSALCLSALLICAGCAGPETTLHRQQAAWNQGDLDGFLDGYARSSKLTFIGGGEVVVGWDAVRDRYHRLYSSPEARGALSFSDLRTRYLASRDDALVTGVWRVDRAEDAKWGRFTLLMRRSADGTPVWPCLSDRWYIIHDHTSSGVGPPPPGSAPAPIPTTQATQP